MKKIYFIFILPLITLIGSFLLRAASGPFWQYGDPPYNYIFNAYQIVKGHSPTEVGHPGTPLQVFIAFTIWIFNLGRSSADAVNQALINPEFYLWAVFIFLVLAAFVTSSLLAYFVYRKTNDKLAAILSQVPGLSFLIMPCFDNGSFPVLPVVANVSAEPVFIIIMNLFNLFVLGLYFAENKSQELRFLLFLAFICGLGLATKINFLIILLTALMIVPLRKKPLFFIACAASFVFCTIPIIPRYPLLFSWITDIVNHSSRYGSGDQKFIDWGSFVFYLKLMFHADWFFILTAIAMWTWSTIRLFSLRQDRDLRFIWTLSLWCLIDMAATAKHFSFHYLLPCFGLFSSIFVLFYLNQKERHQLSKPLAAIFILVFTCVCIFYAIPYGQRLKVLTDDIHQFNDTVNTKYPQCTVIPSTTGDIDFFLTNQEVMQRSNGTAFRLESEDLYRLYPHNYYFFSEEVTSPDPTVESYGIWNYKERVYADDILNSCPCTIFIKYASDLSEYPFQVRSIEHSKFLNAYLLTGSTEKEANYLFAKALEAFKKGNYQEALALGLKSRELNYEPRRQLEYILTIIYHDLMNSKRA